MKPVPDSDDGVDSRQIFGDAGVEGDHLRSWVTDQAWT